MTNPAKFMEEVKQEARKVTWPNRKETLATTAMVFVMVAIASVFFFLVDLVVSNSVQALLGIG